MKLRCLFFALLGFLWSVAVYPDAAANELVRYLGIQNVPEQDLQTLSHLKATAEAPALTPDQRKAAYLELFKQMARIQSSTVPEPVLQSLAGYAVTWYCDGRFGKEVLHTARPGELGAVVKRGHGIVPMILIPDAGFDASVFQSFMDRNEKDYTMYAVTLPGFSGTPAIPRLAHRDYAQLQLWKNAETAVLNLISREHLKNTVVVGHQAGAYLAVRLAIDRPDVVRSAVVLNGLLYMPMPSQKNPSGRLSAEDSGRLLKSFLPVEIFPRPSEQCTRKSWLSVPGMLSLDPAKSEAIADNAMKSDAFMVWDYSAELRATDLTDEIAGLKRPVLVVPCVESTESAPKAASVTQWQSVHSPQLKVIQVQKTGPFVMQDQPQELDRIIHQFIFG